MILCQFQNPGVGWVLAALKATTGWGLTTGDLMTLGRRIVTVRRLFNMRRGLTRSNDCLPYLLRVPPSNGGTEGNGPNLESLLAGAYAEYGWGLDTGRPAEDVLNALGLASG